MLGFLLVLILAAGLGGFIAFATHIDRSSMPAELPRADGIVVWTGKGGGRLETAGQLMRDGRGERLLVSGVNEKIDETAVAELLGLDEDETECCLDLDYAALDTRGNAQETAAWAQSLGYDHIILVTSAYHMPRARVELSQAMGALRVTPVPVQAADTPDWWRDGGRAKRLLGEYGKYGLSLARGRTEGSESREPVAETLPEAAATEPPDDD